MDRLRRGGTGAAPISPELLKWYWSIGVPLVEGYGMTETAGIATINTPGDNRVGTIGKPVPGTDGSPLEWLQWCLRWCSTCWLEFVC